MQCSHQHLYQRADWKIFTNAGPEIGVASTKAFTTQLAALLMLAVAIAKSQDKNSDLRSHAVQDLRNTPSLIQSAFDLLEEIQITLQKSIAEKENSLFLGRGMYFPIAQEGAS